MANSVQNKTSRCFCLEWENFLPRAKFRNKKRTGFLFWHSFLDCFTWKHYSNTRSCVAFLCNNYHLKIKIYSLVTNEFKRWWNVLNPQTLDLKDKVVTDKWRPGPGHIKKGESCCLSSTSIARKKAQFSISNFRKIPPSNGKCFEMLPNIWKIIIFFDLSFKLNTVQYWVYLWPART